MEGRSRLKQPPSMFAFWSKLRRLRIGGEGGTARRRHGRPGFLCTAVAVAVLLVVVAAGLSVDAFTFTSAASRSLRISISFSSRASSAHRSAPGSSNGGIRRQGLTVRTLQSRHRRAQKSGHATRLTELSVSRVASPSTAIFDVPLGARTASETAAESEGVPVHVGDVTIHRLDAIRTAHPPTNEFLPSHDDILPSASAFIATSAPTGNGTGAEWSRAAQIAGVVGRATQPILVSWIRTRAFPSSSGDDSDFWALRSGGGVSDGEGGSGGGNNNSAPPTHAERVTMALEELGCTFVKFGQALSSRPDVIPPTLASALAKLRDRMEPFDTKIATDIVRRELSSALRKSNNKNSCILDENGLDGFLASFSDKPLAAASIGQVYKGHLAGYGPVAVKVRRPNIETTVERDAALLKGLAQRIERISQWYQSTTNRPPLVQAKLSDAVDEFMGRIREELDYRREAQNLETFANLYAVSKSESSSQANKNRRRRGRHVQVVVPNLVRGLCTENVLVMEWLDGTKLVDDDVVSSSATVSGSSFVLPDSGANDKGPMVDTSTNLALVETGIQCTLSQLLDTGILHADPHAGNLLKVPRQHDGSSGISYELGYLDFGLISTVPSGVRDGLVCAVSQLVFARNVDKVAQLFGDLQLLPDRVLQDPNELQALTSALNDVFERVLDYSYTTQLPTSQGNSTHGGRSKVPVLRFDNLLSALAGLVTRFEFRLPPYFLNNARALGTLEGIAKSLDPNFNVLRVVYPYALDRLFTNPSNSPVVDSTLIDLVKCPTTGQIDSSRVARLLDDSASLTGYSRRRVVRDVLRTRGGRRFARRVARGIAKEKVATALRWGSMISKIVPSDYFKL